ncbi:MAG: FecR domain-containing protein [Myxococcota bacterium]
MNEDELQAWAHAQRQPRPSPQDASGLVNRWQRRTRRRFVTRTGFGLALAAAVVAFVLTNAPDPVVAPVPEVVTAAPIQLAPGLHETNGDAIDVADNSSVTVLAPGRFVLTSGTVAIEARSRPKTAPLTVQAGDVTVTVVGTRFIVTLDPLRVEVTEGVVAVEQGGARHLVRAGEVFPPLDDVPPAPLPPLDALRNQIVSGNLDSARLGLRYRLATDPTDADTWVVLAQLEGQGGKVEAARTAWRAVVEHGRTRQAQRARFELARSFEDEPENALGWLEAYLADPGVLAPEARLRLGLAQRQLGRPEAENTLRQVIVDHPGTAAAARARTLLGEPR